MITPKVRNDASESNDVQMVELSEVLMISTVHSVDDVRIIYKEAVSLQAAGYQVSYLVATKSEATQVCGVELLKVKPSSKRILRVAVTGMRAFYAAFRSKAKICHFHDPEFLPYAALLALAGKKVIYDAHEDVASSIRSKFYLPRPLRSTIARAVGMLEQVLVHACDHVIAATDTISHLFPKRKTSVIQNFPILSELSVDAKLEVEYSERPPHVAYVGGVTRIRGATEMVAAMEHVPDQLGATLCIAGRCVPAALKDELVKLQGSKHVTWRGNIDRREVASMLNQCRMGIVLFHPEPNHVNAQPNKLFEYMSVGIPVIASDFPLWRSIVDGCQCGILVDPMDPVAIAAAVSWLLENPEKAEKMGRRGAEAVRLKYSWDSERTKLVELYGKLSLKV